MMIEPQKLDYVASDLDPPAILSRFRDQDDPIEFPVSKVSDNFKNLSKYHISFLLSFILFLQCEHFAVVLFY